MLSESAAFSSFSVNDLQGAKTFYQDILGLKVSDNPMGLIELHLHAGSKIIVYPKPDHVPATFTVLNFPVKNIDEKAARQHPECRRTRRHPQRRKRRQRTCRLRLIDRGCLPLKKFFA